MDRLAHQTASNREPAKALSSTSYADSESATPTQPRSGWGARPVRQTHTTAQPPITRVSTYSATMRVVV